MLDKKIEKALDFILKEEGYTKEQLCILTIKGFSFFFVDTKPKIHLLGQVNKHNDFIRRDTFSGTMQHFYESLLSIELKEELNV